MQKIAIYPGTFDPMTNGHTSLVLRATKLFDIIIIAVAENTRKHPQYDLNKRLTMVKTIFSESTNIRVKSFNNLLVDFARAENAQIILRGLRMVSDFEYEFQLASMNRLMHPEIETLFLPAIEETGVVSSSLVKEILNLGGDISPFVDARILPFLLK